MDTKQGVITKLKIAWGDMDALGHVNNTVYFKYFETARIAYFNALQLGPVTTAAEWGPILAKIDCTFKMPLVFPDEISIRVFVSKIGNTSMVMRHEVFSEKLQAVAAVGDGVVVFVNYKTGEKVVISDDLRGKVEGLG